ncbi:tol-pal system protein YbgF [Methylotenera sp.]|uniref:tol-pal system protein YbgF n=1 Tax=Methylotenera sp. TaxID=2051956 RepID=UPI0025DEBCA7|nr:tol-pal system protein YbgF [Methylotenera sp.]
MMRKLVLASLLLTSQLFAMQSHAALFDDKEARKKILEVESTMQSQNQATQAELANLKKSQQALDQRVQAIEAITKGGALLEMQNQVESLKQEVAKLKGELELANHTVEATQQRQKDLYGDTDVRLRKLESGASAEAPAEASATTPVAPVVTAPAKNTQEYQLLELANGLSKEAKHKDAFNAYDKFLKDYPNSALADEATYGLGYSQFVLRNYKSAIATQQKMLDLHPESPKVPDAMLNLANSQIQLGLVPGAKKTLRDLIAKYPNSEVTPTAQKRLKALEAIR